MKLEIRPGEGGEDARLFMTDMASAYVKLFNRFG